MKLLGLAAFVGFLLFLGAVAGAELNMENRCTADGTWCVPDCNPEHFQAVAEDEPCWRVQSEDSDWQAPWYALRIKDYRQ